MRRAALGSARTAVALGVFLAAAESCRGPDPERAVPARDDGGASRASTPGAPSESPATASAVGHAAPLVPSGEPSALPVSSLDASAPPAVVPQGKAAGARCTSSRQCRAGLACCESGFRGQCGGAFTTDVAREPCVIFSMCSTAPCRPFSLPP
ncbi:MAG TPA: hypothetical protein VMI54_15445 [Polyangiaceae bacterium]|nr:hypothetical protein [Polyangiaceae bacterium]